MQITEELAKPICERLMSLLPYNINIMNEKGMIVASGDTSRVGQRHDGAIQVLLMEREIFLNEQEAVMLSGTKPGVNLPISFAQKTVGVVGITGNPDDVYSYAHLIKMTVEILLEQMNIRSQMYYRQNALRDWIHQLTDKEPLNIKYLQSLADTLHIDLHKARTVFVIQLIHRSNKQQGYPIWDDFMMQLIRNQFAEDAICGELHTNMLFLAITTHQHEHIHTVAQRIRTTFSYHKIQIRIGIGKKQIGIDGYRSSCIQAKQSLRLQELLKTNQPMYIEDWGLIRLIEAIPLTLRHDFLMTYLPLCSQINEENWHTLEVFFGANLSIKEASKKLHIHRNTLLYRLDRLYEILKLNPRNFTDAVILQVLILCRKCTPD